MKKIIYMMFLTVLIIPSFARPGRSQDEYGRQMQQNRDMIKQQYSSDIERKEAILRKMREFMSEINGRLGKGSKTRIDVPIDMNEATDIKKTEAIHSPEKPQVKVFAYANVDVQIRSEGNSKSQAVGKVNFGEELLLIVQSEERETIDDRTFPWILVRRSNGEEGWMFGAYLQKEKPVKKAPVVARPDGGEKSKDTLKKDSDKFYAYVMDDDVRFRSEGSTGGRVIGKLEYAEKIEVLVQSKNMDTINGVKSPWFLVKRSNGDEGWVFGGFLQKKQPKERDKLPDVQTARTESGRQTDFMLPAVGRVSSKFGYRVHPVTRRSESFHSGIDIMAPRGTRVNATADGVIKIAEFNKNGYGNLIVVEHEKDITSYYGHLEKILVKPGQRVVKGDVIGTVDSTGMSTGNHLHFEIRRGKTALDPDAYLR